jgi:hypothetical protein
VGVEFSPELHAIAQTNMSKLRLRNPNAASVELHCRDATEVGIPGGDLVCYFYNPFDGAILEKVLQKIEASWKRSPRDLVLVYRNPVHADVFERFSHFKCTVSNSSYRLYRAHSSA